MRMTMLLCCSLTSATPGICQTINLMPTKRSESLTVYNAEAKTEFGFPAGASAGLSSGGGSGDAGALLGFQVWKKDEGLLAVFFNYAGPNTISGSQKDFGKFLLNPGTQGSSLFTTGNLILKGKDKGVQIGGTYRFGVTFTTWQATVPGTDPSYEGFLIYLAPALLVSSRTFDAGNDNEYQLGFEIGPGFRALGGDLAQADLFRSAPTVLGFNETFVG